MVSVTGVHLGIVCNFLLFGGRDEPCILSLYFDWFCHEHTHVCVSANLVFIFLKGGGGGGGGKKKKKNVFHI